VMHCLQRGGLKSGECLFWIVRVADTVSNNRKSSSRGRASVCVSFVDLGVLCWCLSNLHFLVGHLFNEQWSHVSICLRVFRTWICPCVSMMRVSIEG